MWDTLSEHKWVILGLSRNFRATPAAPEHISSWVQKHLHADLPNVCAKQPMRTLIVAGGLIRKMLLAQSQSQVAGVARKLRENPFLASAEVSVPSAA